MSADNRLCMMEWFGEWHVWQGSLSEDYFEPASDAVHFPTREDATDYMYKKSDSMTVLEGGCMIVGIKEQTVALSNMIDIFTDRLKRLNETGYQYPNDQYE